jgi:WhiB family redox-sensing transcriptional regulator
VSENSRLPLAVTENWDWQLDAACRGMDSTVFFHPAEERPRARERRTAAARKICDACPVDAECLSHALVSREAYGIWGGLSESQRADILGVRSLRFPGRKPDDPTDSTPEHPATRR